MKAFTTQYAWYVALAIHCAPSGSVADVPERRVERKLNVRNAQQQEIRKAHVECTCGGMRKLHFLHVELRPKPE